MHPEPLTRRHRPGRGEAVVAALIYTALTIVFTWPLARGLARDLPGDFGDPLLNSWIVAWGASHLGRGWWNANIFFPHPLALGYSEHLLPQVLQALPIYAITKNPILCYNLLFLSTFVLSALGMFLFAREMTGSRDAALVAGIAYAFAPYRVPSIPHLQVLSSAWMPFALYGFHRFFVRVSAGDPPSRQQYLPLAGGAVAWLAENLSSGYYLLFFSPVAIGYLVWELSTRALWRQRRVLAAVLGMCTVVALVTAAFTLPYVELRRLGFQPRSLDETARFSADVYAYLTADPNLRLWGTIARAWPHAEGALFPGLTIVVLALIAIGTASGGSHAFRPAAWLALAPLALLVALLFGWSVRLPGVKIASFPRALATLAVVYGITWVVAPRARLWTRRWLSTPAGLFTVVLVFAIVMSWGPSIHAKGRAVASTNVYALFYDFVPGFDGVRAPARFAMVATLALALLSGVGITAIARVASARGIAIAATFAILAESLAIPFPINQNAVAYSRPGLAPLPDSVWPVPAVYAFVTTLPATAAIVELPLGEPAFDARYMFYSTTHWRALVNGYSGGGPADYERLDQGLQDAVDRPDAAWQALSAARATHAIVHEAYFAGDRGPRTSDWLRAHGAREVGAFGPDRIFRMP